MLQVRVLPGELLFIKLFQGVAVLGPRVFPSPARSLSSTALPTGDQALIATFHRGGYEVIATDDARLIRILRSAGIPFMVSALLIYALHTKGTIDQKTALDWLDKLSVFVSDEEYAVTKLLLEGKK